MFPSVIIAREWALSKRLWKELRADLVLIVPPGALLSASFAKVQQKFHALVVAQQVLLTVIFAKALEQLNSDRLSM